MNFIDPKIDKYSVKHTKPEPLLLQQLTAETQHAMALPQMLSGRIEGRLLKLLVQLTRAKTVLELGMFTGYSALSMAEGLPAEGRVITCEVDPKAQAMAEKYFAKSPHGHKIEVRMGPALDTIAALTKPIDLAFIDADKANYIAYYEAILAKLRQGGLIVLDNMLWSGAVLNPQDQNSQVLHELNEKIVDDHRVENVLLPLRDGITLVRKN
jgi:caffeoyl-CoA O-methyltransferase